MQLALEPLPAAAAVAAVPWPVGGVKCHPTLAAAAAAAGDAVVAAE